MTAPPAGALEACLALLPCPGCGGTRTRTIGGPGTKGGPKYWAGCDVCHWRTWGDTESDAIAAWNRRTDAAALRLREGCEAQVESLRHKSQTIMNGDMRVAYKSAADELARVLEEGE